jgi:membrane protease YdiL (CAAX protease family)
VNSTPTKSYPTILDAVHLVVLYIFIQSIVDFPLALLDYSKGTHYLDNPIKKIVLGIGSVVFIFWFAWRKAGVPLKELFPVRRFNVLILLPILIFLWAAQNILGEINFQLEKVLPAPSWFVELFTRVFENDYGVYGAIIKVAIIAPIIEEMIFRGIIMHGLMRNYSAFTAVSVSALMFALFHLNPWQFPATFILGLLLGILMYRTRNIILCILGHAINNGLVLFSIYYFDTVQKTNDLLVNNTGVLIFSAVVAAVTLIVIFLLSLPANRTVN